MKKKAMSLHLSEDVKIRLKVYAATHNLGLNEAIDKLLQQKIEVYPPEVRWGANSYEVDAECVQELMQDYYNMENIIREFIKRSDTKHEDLEKKFNKLTRNFCK